MPLKIQSLIQDISKTYITLEWRGTWGPSSSTVIVGLWVEGIVLNMAVFRGWTLGK